MVIVRRKRYLIFWGDAYGQRDFNELEVHNFVEIFMLDFEHNIYLIVMKLINW